ncbi:MAG: hypothetical protein WC878_05990 [Candidatus Paceibacterota bacterium]|jgi:hypothetical protein
MRQHKQIFAALSVALFIVPQIAFASWWNPLSWSMWNIFKPTPYTQQVQVVTTTPKVSETTKKTVTIKTQKNEKIPTREISSKFQESNKKPETVTVSTKTREFCDSIKKQEYSSVQSLKSLIVDIKELCEKVTQGNPNAVFVHAGGFG